MSTPVKLPAEVKNIIHHADGVKSFIMRPLKPCPIFSPGQFLHLAIDDYDPSFHWPESRVFSIANAPTRRDKIKITFSIKGHFTKRMFDDIKIGDVLWLKLPFGMFSFSYKEKEIILIAGGTGITPFVSFLEYAIDNRIVTKINLYYGVRSPEYLIFDSLLEECQKKLNRFKYQIFIEKNLYKGKLQYVNTGIIPIPLIINENSSNRSALFYISGPQQMILTFREKLMESGIDNNNIKVDEWE